MARAFAHGSRTVQTQCLAQRYPKTLAVLTLLNLALEDYQFSQESETGIRWLECV
jgi:hypothetical protein